MVIAAKSIDKAFEVFLSKIRSKLAKIWTLQWPRMKVFKALIKTDKDMNIAVAANMALIGFIPKRDLSLSMYLYHSRYKYTPQIKK